MRRDIWLLAPLLVSCTSTEVASNLYSHPTRLRVVPSAFLGDVPCNTQGGMQLYQATLWDVTDGWDSANELPSSGAVPCGTSVEFSFVLSGRLYVADVAGYDRSNLRAQNPGSTVIVDEAGASVPPRWTTTCWGRDNVDYSQSLGGSAPEDSAGGAGGAGPVLGVASVTESVVVVRGCEPLRDAGGETSTTTVRFDLEGALLGLSCGEAEGEVSRFRITAEPQPGGPAPEGTAGAPASAAWTLEGKCGATLVAKDQAGDAYLTYAAEGFASGSDVPLWRTDCAAFTVTGVGVPAQCVPAPAL